MLEYAVDYFPPKALGILERGHLFGLPALFSKKITGKWILLKTRWALALPMHLARPFIEEPISDMGVCTFYVARRKA